MEYYVYNNYRIKTYSLDHACMNAGKKLHKFRKKQNECEKTGNISKRARENWFELAITSI